MKFQSPALPGVSGNVVREDRTDFRIGDASKIIHILRSSLYAHPVRTLVQEYLSNARDAMREAGRGDEPFEVSLPTVLSPVLKIRDFGVGLSADRVRMVFCAYGVSTKDADASMTGGFGLGAKSAWAYTDSFVVTSYLDGVKSTYVCHTGETFAGTMDLLAVEETAERNGTEVQIPLKSPLDHSRFVDAFYRATFFWPVRPNLLGVHADEIPTTYAQSRSFAKGPGWTLFSSDPWISSLLVGTTTHPCHGVAVIDGIPYFLPGGIIHDDVGLTTLLKDRAILCVDFGNDEIAVAASRESVTASERTRKLLQVGFKSVVGDTILGCFRAKLEAAKTWAEIASLAKGLRGVVHLGKWADGVCLKNGELICETHTAGGNLFLRPRIGTTEMVVESCVRPTSRRARRPAIERSPGIPESTMESGEIIVVDRYGISATNAKLRVLALFEAREKKARELRRSGAGGHQWDKDVTVVSLLGVSSRRIWLSAEGVALGEMKRKDRLVERKRITSEHSRAARALGAVATVTLLGDMPELDSETSRAAQPDRTKPETNNTVALRQVQNFLGDFSVRKTRVIEFTVDGLASQFKEGKAIFQQIEDGTSKGLVGIDSRLFNQVGSWLREKGVCIVIGGSAVQKALSELPGFRSVQELLVDMKSGANLSSSDHALIAERTVRPPPEFFRCVNRVVAMTGGIDDTDLASYAYERCREYDSAKELSPRSGYSTYSHEWALRQSDAWIEAARRADQQELADQGWTERYSLGAAILSDPSRRSRMGIDIEKPSMAAQIRDLLNVTKRRTTEEADGEDEP